MKKLKTKNGDVQKNGPVVKSVESVLRLEGSLWWERFVGSEREGELLM